MMQKPFHSLLVIPDGHKRRIDVRNEEDKEKLYRLVR